MKNTFKLAALAAVAAVGIAALQYGQASNALATDEKKAEISAPAPVETPAAAPAENAAVAPAPTEKKAPAAAKPEAKIPQPGLNPAASITPQEYPSFREGDYVLGDAKAPVTMFEYASLSCTHCAHFHKEILPKLQEKYIDKGKLRVVFRPFPLNEPALRAAQLTMCVDREKYTAFTKVLFSQQDKWAFEENFIEQLAKIAAVGGVSREAFDACMADTSKEMKIVEERKYGAEKLKINSTPTFFIGKEVIEGARPVEDFAKVIDPLLK